MSYELREGSGSLFKNLKNDCKSMNAKEVPMNPPDFTECDKTARFWDQWSKEDCKRMANAYLALRVAGQIKPINEDIISRHSGKTTHREWWSGGEWLYPGDEIVIRESDSLRASADKLLRDLLAEKGSS